MEKDPSQTLEALARYYGWDEMLCKLLFSLPRWLIDQYIFEANTYDKDGWRYILPALPSSASILCLDTRFGNATATFVETGASVTVIHYCPVTLRIIQYRLATMHFPNVKIIQVTPKSGQLPFPDEGFDAFIYHDIRGDLSTDFVANFGFAMTAAFLAEIHRIVKLGGFAYFGVKNRFGFDMMKKKLFSNKVRSNKPAPHGVSIRSIARLIERTGFGKPQIYPYIVERGRVSEIIPNIGYRSVKNSFTISEKFKQVILGKIGVKFFASAYGLVCAKSYLHRNQIQGFVQNLVAQKIMAKPPEIWPYFQRYLSQRGKVFITLSNSYDNDKNIIIVIPLRPNVLIWRRKEITIVNELRMLSPYLASKLPSLYCESSWNGETYFALSKMSGITVDCRVPHLERLTCHAVEFLIQFNQITAREAVIDENIYSDLVGSMIKQVTDTYPMVEEIMGHIERLLHAVCLGKSLSIVWFHGDYKLENLLINKDTLEINGIIDWEQSRRQGLPWLDFLYLLAYNRIITEDRDFLDVYHKVILSQNFTNSERRLVEVYALAMPVAPDLKQVLICLFFIHHIGYRYKYNMGIEKYRHKILHRLEEIKKCLACLTV